MPDSTGQELLRQLALDLRSSWNHAADELWSRLDPDLWARTHNAWVVLRSASPARVAAMLDDQKFRAEVDRLAGAARAATQTMAWFQRAHSSSALKCAAFFSMEFMLSEALPIYAGGLGNVAGDHLKAASDLGVPVIGVGLLYQQGYFRQVIGLDGSQQALYPYNDPGQLPIRPVHRADGELLRLELHLPGYSVWLRAWQVIVGRTQLYLLDSNDIANHPAHRGITSELYGGGPELRLQQEMVLGIGGWRLLEALGLSPEVCHLNEGHAALVILDRARAYMQASGQSFAVALAVTRGGNVFTTHTAVPAGFDYFSASLIERYLGRYAAEQLQISLHDLMALGRQDPNDESQLFNMAYLAVHGSAATNGVSRLHGEVSRRIFQPLFPRWPVGDIPVSHVTNGIHTPSWDSSQADELWTSVGGKDRWLGDLDGVGEQMRAVSDEALWRCRASSRAELVEYARARLAHELQASGDSVEEVEAARHRFQPDALTLGFARRFATYKRPNLLLQDSERLVRLLTNPDRPVQLIIAGKAHPADAAGQALIRDWIQFIRRQDVKAHAIFLDDYDMLLTEHLVQGVDVWINTPRRPWEACGTSGMKVLVNGGLNLSELDGWWVEAYAPEVGWAIGDGREHGESDAWDRTEARQLLELLERAIVPSFYDRDAQGIPRAWVARVRESMARLTPIYSSNRSLRDYVEQCYLPAAAAYAQRAQHNGEQGLQITQWQTALEYNWGSLRLKEVSVESVAGRHRFTAHVHLGAVRAESVRVELYADPPAEGGQACHEPMSLTDAAAVANPAARPDEQIYVGSVPSSRSAADFTVRIVPFHPGAKVPLEAPYVLWQR